MERESQRLVIIDEKALESVVSYRGISEIWRPGILPVILFLANNPDMQNTVQKGKEAIRKAPNLTELNKALENFKEDIVNIKISDPSINNGIPSPISPNRPPGAIPPAIDAIWEALDR